LSYSIKSQLQEEKEARLNKTPEKEARGNMKLMYAPRKKVPPADLHIKLTWLHERSQPMKEHQDARPTSPL
jgi:hypothetical protein